MKLWPCPLSRPVASQRASFQKQPQVTRQPSGSVRNLCCGGRCDAINGRRNAGLARTGTASAGSVSRNKRLIFEVLCFRRHPNGAVGRMCRASAFKVASLFGVCMDALQHRRVALIALFANGRRSAGSFGHARQPRHRRVLGHGIATHSCFPLAGFSLCSRRYNPSARRRQLPQTAPTPDEVQARARQPRQSFANTLC